MPYSSVFYPKIMISLDRAGKKYFENLDMLRIIVIFAANNRLITQTKYHR